MSPGGRQLGFLVLFWVVVTYAQTFFFYDKAIYFNLHSAKTSSASPVRKKQSQCGNCHIGSGVVSPKAQQPGMSCFTLFPRSPPKDAIGRWEMENLWNHCTSAHRFQPVSDPLQYSRKRRFFTIYFQYAFLASQYSSSPLALFIPSCLLFLPYVTHSSLHYFCWQYLF